MALFKMVAKTKNITKDKYPGFIELLANVQAIAAKARKYHQSLDGAAFYAKKFADLTVACTLEFTNISNRLAANRDDGIRKAIRRIGDNLDICLNPITEKKERDKSVKDIEFSYRTVIEPALSGKPLHIPSDELFPQEILKNTRGYLESVAHQACGCYDQGWYDASAVMCRRLLETLIIETYEAHNISNNIKKGDGTFFYLSDLIDSLLAEKSWNISRNVRKALPQLKEIGNLSAHDRRYTAKKPDFTKIQSGLRITVEELVHLAKFK